MLKLNPFILTFLSVLSAKYNYNPPFYVPKTSPVLDSCISLSNLPAFISVT